MFTNFSINMKMVNALKPNEISVMTSSIQGSARLPLSRIRGTATERNKTAQYYSDLLKFKLEKVSRGKRCHINDFKKILNEILSPDKISLDIKSQAVEFSISDFSTTYGSLERRFGVSECSLFAENTRIDFYHRKCYGYEMCLPMDASKDIITNKYVALHEARHLFDYICNPKMIVERDLNVSQNKEKKKAYINAYKTFYKGICIPFMGLLVKLKTQKYLSKLSDEECINCIQEIRTSIQTEINAYRDMLIYMRNERSYNFIDIMNIDFTLYLLNYPKKLKIVNQMLAKKIFEVRDKMHPQKMF